MSGNIPLPLLSERLKRFGRGSPMGTAVSLSKMLLMPSGPVALDISSWITTYILFNSSITSGRLVLLSSMLNCATKKL